MYVIYKVYLKEKYIEFHKNCLTYFISVKTIFCKKIIAPPKTCLFIEFIWALFMNVEQL